ncbi:MAG: hypothetical protein WCF61_14125 [Terriglobales bacterium]
MNSRFLKVFLSFWAAQALAGVSVAAPKQVNPPFSITISTETPTIRARTGLSIMVRITNTSNHDINASSVYVDGVAGIDGSYDEDVRDSKGNLAKRKQPQEADPNAPVTMSHRLRTLKPGESTGSVTGVSRQYDISQPGQYVIQLSRRISDNPKDGVVKSNKITITVIP